MTIADDLIAVRTLLEAAGRTKGELEDEDGSFCLVGAIKRVTGDRSFALDKREEDEILERYYSVLEALTVHIPHEIRERPELVSYTVLMYFNDQPDTSDQDVFDLIDKALAEVGGMCE